MVKEQAKAKLAEELKNAKNKSFADPIIGYLIARCEEDDGLAQDVMQEHKTWKKCFNYIYAEAKKLAKGNCAAVRDDVVFEWAEDYYHKDDKAEEEKKAKEEAERKKKAKEDAKKRAEQKKDQKPAAPAPEQPKIDKPKPKKNSKVIEGQTDLFSMMGL